MLQANNPCEESGHRDGFDSNDTPPNYIYPDVSNSQPVFPPTALGPSRTRNNRAHLACNHCRLRKARCDGQEPCINCLEVRMTCVYQDYSLPRLGRAIVALEKGRSRRIRTTFWDLSSNQICYIGPPLQHSNLTQISIAAETSSSSIT